MGPIPDPIKKIAAIAIGGFDEKRNFALRGHSTSIA
jgi:hypothetical protein